MRTQFQYTLILCALPFFLSGDSTANAQKRISQRRTDRAVDPFPPGRGAVIRQATIRLVSELEHLQEDISMDLRGPDARRLYYEADEILAGALHFQRSVEAERSREHLYRDFQAFDGKLHEFFEKLQNSRSRAIERHIQRVHYADDQLHQALSEGDNSNDRRAEVIARQAHALDREAQYFVRLADRVLAEERRNQRLQEALRNFSGAAEHFHKTAEKSNDTEHIAEDFAEVRREWYNAVRLLNSSRQSAFLYQQAQRLGQTIEELDRRLSPQGRPHRRDTRRHDDYRDAPPSLEFRFRTD